MAEGIQRGTVARLGGTRVANDFLFPRQHSWYPACPPGSLLSRNRSLRSKYENGTNYMEVTAIATDGTPSIPLDLRYRIENGVSPFGRSSRSTGSSSNTPTQLQIVPYEWAECEFEVRPEADLVLSYWERRDCPSQRPVSAYVWEGPQSDGTCFAQAAWSDRSQADRDRNRIVTHIRFPSYDGVCP